MITISNAGAIALSGLLALPIVAQAACKLEMLELPVKMVGSRAVATVGINGTPVPLTVDTGAFHSMLTEAAATQLNLLTRRNPALRVEGITGPVDARVTRVDKLQLLNGDLPRVNFVVGGNEPGAGTMGLMGRNMLSFTDTEYDLANGVIRFSFPSDECAKANLAYWAGASHVSAIELEPEQGRGSKTPALRARVKLNGSEFMALFDTGAMTVVTAQAARRAGVAQAQMTPAGTLWGAGQGSAKGWTAPFDRVEVGDEAILHNRLHVGDFSLDDADLLMGIDYFLSHRIYVSKAHAKMFVTYNGGTVFALNRTGNAGALPLEAEPATQPGPELSADELARRGAAFAARQEYERALADLNRSIDLAPGSADHLAQRGAVLQSLKRPADAMHDFDRALELDPTHADARFRRAALHLPAHPDRARSDLEALDQALASQAHMRLAMSGLYFELKEPARSLAQLNHWLRARPDEAGRDHALSWRCWARSMLAIELDKALDDCNAAVDSTTDNASHLEARGWLHLRLGGYQKALADFDRAIASRPTAWTLYGSGLARTGLGDPAKGEADLEAARKAMPDIDLKVAGAGFIPAPSPRRVDAAQR